MDIQAFATTEDQRKLLAKDYAARIQQLLRGQGYRRIEIEAMIDDAGKLAIELKRVYNDSREDKRSARHFFNGFVSGLQSQIVTQSNVIMRQAAQIEELERKLADLEGDKQTQEEVKMSNRLEIDLGEMFPGLVGTKQQKSDSDMTGRKH